jgi:hypothetical protein
MTDKELLSRLMASKVVSDEGYGDIPRNVYTEAVAL